VIPATLGILGLGALGGSIARRAKLAGVRTVLGWAPEPVARGVAARQGAIDDALPDPRTVAERAELVVVALPLPPTLTLLPSLAAIRSDAWITDTAPVKRAVVSAAERAGLGGRFAGSHPLVRWDGGFDQSRADLLCHATVYVTSTAAGERAAREIADFWESVCEAHTVTLDPDAHDAQMALIEQLPQATAALLARLLADRLPTGTALGSAARDTTRAMLADPAQLTEALLANRDHVRAVLAALQGPLGALDRALEEGSVPAVREWLGTAAAWRRRLEERPR